MFLRVNSSRKVNSRRCLEPRTTCHLKHKGRNTLLNWTVSLLVIFHLAIENYPAPQNLTRKEVQQSQLPLEIQRWLPWIEQITKDHCLYQTIVDCLQDEPESRPRMADIHMKFAVLSQAQSKTLAMVADLLEMGKSEVMLKFQELAFLKYHVNQVRLYV